MTLLPGCDQIGWSKTPARRSCFGAPLYIVMVSYRANHFVLDFTWSILRKQFVIWISTLMLIYPNAHMFWKQRRRVLLLCNNCEQYGGQYGGACRWLPANHWSCHWFFVSWTTSTRRCPVCLVTNYVVYSDGIALARHSRSSRLQGCYVGRPSWSCSAVPVIIATSRCGHGLKTSACTASTAIPVCYRWRSLISCHRTMNMEQFTGDSTLSAVSVFIQTKVKIMYIFLSIYLTLTFLT